MEDYPILMKDLETQRPRILHGGWQYFDVMNIPG
jgi:hypothetical protein